MYAKKWPRQWLSAGGFNQHPVVPTVIAGRILVIAIHISFIFKQGLLVVTDQLFGLCAVVYIRRGKGDLGTSPKSVSVE